MENKAEINERQNDNYSLKKVETDTHLRRLKYTVDSSHKVCLKLFFPMKIDTNLKMKCLI